MDLWSNGWLDDPALWSNIATMRRVYEHLWATAPGLGPEVAIVVDDASFAYDAQGAATNKRLLADQRLAFYRAGFSYGLYLLSDVARGKVHGPKLYIFLNAHALSADERTGIEALRAGGCTLAWVYGTDLFGTTASMARLTGLELAPAPKGTKAVVRVASDADGPWSALRGQTLGADLRGATLFAVAPGPGTQAIGTYDKTNLVALAAKRDSGGSGSIFYGSWSLTAELLRAMAQWGGVHVYLDTNDVLQTDGRFFSLYASTPGAKTLRLPAPATVTDAVTGAVLARAATSITIAMRAGECRWLLADAAE